MPEKLSAMQIGALAALLHELRPDWVPAAVAATIRNRNDGAHPFPALALAAVRAATGNLIENPGGIFQDGPHWRGETHTAEAGTPAHRLRCPDHPQEHADNCRCCLADVKAGMRPLALVGHSIEEGR